MAPEAEAAAAAAAPETAVNKASSDLLPDRPATKAAAANNRAVTGQFMWGSKRRQPEPDDEVAEGGGTTLEPDVPTATSPKHSANAHVRDAVTAPGAVPVVAQTGMSSHPPNLVGLTGHPAEQLVACPAATAHVQAAQPRSVLPTGPTTQHARQQNYSGPQPARPNTSALPQRQSDTTTAQAVHADGTAAQHAMQQAASQLKQVHATANVQAQQETVTGSALIMQSAADPGDTMPQSDTALVAAKQQAIAQLQQDIADVKVREAEIDGQVQSGLSWGLAVD